MNEHYEEISRLATKGDANALRDLFKIAEGHESEECFQKATISFRDAAIAYRISAFRNLARAEEAEQQVAQLSVNCDVYKKWIESNPNGMRKLPYQIPGITTQHIKKVVVDQLVKDESFAPIFKFLYYSLSALEMEFFSPGGTLQRRAYWLVGEVFGFEGREDAAKFLNDISVRVCLDLLADEVVRRYQIYQEDG
jgi:hypothetical protein